MIITHGESLDLRFQRDYQLDSTFKDELAGLS